MDINFVNNHIQYFKNLERINIALSRGVVNSQLRNIDINKPNSWEFSAFSQNGEDGIIDVLISRIINQNRYFIEIGSSDGIENNTSWLAIAKKYMGLMIEGDQPSSNWASHMLKEINLGVEVLNLFVTNSNVNEVISNSLYSDPDVFSLDIDGNDYYIAKKLLELKFRPKIFIVEYNSAMGPDKSISIPYDETFNFQHAHSTQLYFGCSVTAWKRLLSKFGYKFVTVDLSGTNAFFIDPSSFNKDFIAGLDGLAYQENFYQMTKFKMLWNKQFELIKDMPFVEID